MTPSQRGDADDQHRLRSLRRALNASTSTIEASPPNIAASRPVNNGTDIDPDHRHRHAERVRKLANWDPTYPGEDFDWYTEYVARNAPASLSWLQQPHLRSNKSRNQHADIKGLAFDHHHCRAVAPVEDGSIAIWDLRHADDLVTSSARRGAVVAQSKPGVLSPPSLSLSHVGSRLAALTNASITDSVSIDHVRNKAYIAVEHALNEVDLETLQVSTYVEFANPITALSKVDYPLPLTVGTAMGVHLFDPRALKAHGYATLESLDESRLLLPHQPAQRHPTSRLHLIMQHNHAIHDATLHAPAHQRGGPLAIHTRPFYYNPNN